MDDAELNAIRQARLAELQKSSSGGSPSPSTSQNQQQQQAAANDMTSVILGKILETEARERLSRVRIVRPDRAQAVENYIVKLYSVGQIRQKLSEKDIVEILDGLSRDTQQKQQSKIVYNRKSTLDDDDEDDFFD
ncbi:Ymr074c protein [Candida orthopsilosis Co 90-125]|uniref:Ymr074c protein n=1 Tax=Candida orthopsilosis (strain 90-125) TaxID=1136231 RepID=H8X560_CANO9|nr:Ymr074c protein [Candida orthopsilosis Co 90-125]CCG23153.1 Ymr074c protein [Candida orthopsilosis Co 90-125]